jgi:spoIIIJ-associated protein
MAKHIEVSGQTIEEAIQKGLKALDIDKSRANIEILDEGKSGLFGLMGSAPAKIRMSSKVEQDMQAACVTQGQACSEAAAALAAKSKEALSKMLSLLGFDANLSTQFDADGFILNVDSSDSAILIGRNGQTLCALETLLKLMVKRSDNKDIRIGIDIGGYLERRNEKLVLQAKELANKVKAEGMPVSLALSASERRVIHLTLKDSKDVETVSEGEGLDRRITVRPRAAAGE